MTVWKRVLIVASLALVAGLTYLWGHEDGRAGRSGVSSSYAQEAVSPVKARSRDSYFPNSEDLGRNEMRVIACGTGMPTARPSQAAA